MNATCKNGHEWTPENIYTDPKGGRFCISCKRAAYRAWYAQHKPYAGQGRGAKDRIKTHCAQGHPFDERNTRVAVTGQRVCRACQRERYRRDRDREAAQVAALASLTDEERAARAAARETWLRLRENREGVMR